MALIFCMQLTHEKVEQVAFPASLGRDVSILWYSVHNAKGMPALLLPLWLKHFSSLLDCVISKSVFQLQPPSRNMFCQHSETNRTCTAEDVKHFRDTQAPREHVRFTCSGRLWLLGGYITVQSSPYVAFMAHALSTQSGNDRNKHTSQLFFQIIYSIWKGC